MLFSALFFFFNDTATTEIYTLSLHDALPISAQSSMIANLTNRTLLTEMGNRCTGSPLFCGLMAMRKSATYNAGLPSFSPAAMFLAKMSMMKYIIGGLFFIPVGVVFILIWCGL